MTISNLESLKARQEQLVAEAERIIAQADVEDRDLSDDEVEDLEVKNEEIEKLKKQITARESIQIKASSKGRVSAPEVSERTSTVVAARPRDSKWGFESFGHFAKAVKNASIGNEMDQRLRAAAPSVAGNEGNGADGGFAVPPEFRQEIWKKVMGEDSLLSRVDRLTTSFNSLTIPADESTPWQSSGGIQAYWENELGAITPSKPVLEQKHVKLNKLTALVPVSEELLDDAPGMDSYLRRKAPEKMIAKLNTAIVRGTGVGQPLGILNSSSLVTVTAETQAAATLVYANIVKMWSRMYAPLRSNAVWLVNQDIEPQLLNLAFREDATSPVPAYMPANGLSGQPYATLMGRPVIPVQACSTLGTVGDIILVNLDQYMAVTKGADIQTDTSMHFYFDANAIAYRFIFRVAGQPWYNNEITPENGSNTVSWAVALETRD